MKTRKILTALAGILFGFGYIVFSSSIQNTEYIWYLTRIFGMVSILALFIVIFLGELKLLGVNKFQKFHHIFGIATFYFISLHVISAIFEKYQWGKGLSLVDYLGTNFSNKWMVLMSIGAMAFYMILMVSATSMYSVMAKIGYKRWKLTHYLSYMALMFAYIHSVMLGTEFNHIDMQNVYFAVTTFIFVMLMVLLAFRIGKVKLADKGRMIGLLLMVLLVSGGVTYASLGLKTYSEEVDLLSKQKGSVPLQLSDLEKTKADLTDLIAKEQAQIDDFKNMSANTSAMINRARVAVAPTQVRIASVTTAPAQAHVPTEAELQALAFSQAEAQATADAQAKAALEARRLQDMIDRQNRALDLAESQGQYQAPAPNPNPTTPPPNNNNNNHEYEYESDD
jgi:DMSO/TMAO reductase YedYZ heme-binding membrane subunit